MGSVPSIYGCVLLGLGVAACFTACGEDFSAATDADAAGASSLAAGAPTSDGGEPAAGGGSGTGTAGHAGAPEPSEAGSPPVVGAAGAGGAEAGGDAYGDAILADGPLVYWRMSRVNARVVPDETGGGNPLVLQGSGHVVGVPGVVGTDDAAIGFDGVSSFAIATDPRALDFAAAAPFTLECWARREAGGASYFQHLLSNLDGVANNRDGFALYILPEPAQNETARSVFERDRPGNDLGIFGAVTKAGAWGQYVAVYDGFDATLYVNGTLASSTPAPGNLAPRKTAFAVGRSASGSNFFKGAIDEIAIYARALDAATIAKHYALTK